MYDITVIYDKSPGISSFTLSKSMAYGSTANASMKDMMKDAAVSINDSSIIRQKISFREEPKIRRVAISFAL